MAPALVASFMMSSFRGDPSRGRQSVFLFYF
jgi:hypothetical protein